MTGDQPGGLREARERTIDDLCRLFARDELTLGELERRLEKARSARSKRELAVLLPGGRQAEASVTSGPGERTRPARRASPTPEPRRPSTPATRPSSNLAFAIMAGTKRAGRWVPPESMMAVAIMGGVELDFRDAVLREGAVVDINCFAFWGGIEIIVPPDIHVDTHGFALMGGFDQTAEVESDPPAGAPTIRVNGFAMMAGVDVKVVERDALGSVGRRKRLRGRDRG